MNEEARRALAGRPVDLIPDPGPSPSPVFFQSEHGTYRVRTKACPQGTGKIILLEPHPSRNALQSKLALFGLTPRQEEITTWVIRGLSNREIAERLFICEQTVKDHLRDVFEKLKVRSRCELTAIVLGLSSKEQ